MKDIKEKVRDKNPKIRNPASRLPKELVRSAMLETKEKSRMAADKVGRETGEESPVEYAGNRIERAEQRAGKESASAAYRGGKKLAVKTYEKIKEQRQRESVTATLDSETGSGGTSGQTRAKKGRTGAGRSIKIKPEAEKTVKEAGNRTVKTAPRMVKASPVSSQKVKTQALLQKKQAFQSMRAAREAKRAAMRSVQTAKQSAKTAKTTAKGLKAMAEAAAVTPAAFRKLRREIKCFTKRTSFMFQTNFYSTASLPLCRILCFKLTTEPPKEQAQRWSFCIIVFFMSTTFYEISRKSAQKAGCCFLPQAYSTRPFVLDGIVPS